jgi:hypothetical protein
VITGGQNDIFAGATAGTIEGHLQSIWAQAHTGGCKVIQGTIMPTNYGLGVTNSMWQVTQSVNTWIKNQGLSKTTSTTGQYWDELADFASNQFDGITLNGQQNMPGNSTGGAKNFAGMFNDAFNSQGSHQAQAPTFLPWETGVGFAPVNWFFLSDAAGPWNDALVFDEGHDVWHYYQLYGTGGTSTPLFDYNWGNIANGNHICNAFNMASGSGNNHTSLCVKYTSTGSANNALTIAGNGDVDTAQFTTDNRFILPQVATSASAAPACFNGTGGALTNVGCTTSSGVASINGTAGAFTFTGTGVSCTTTTCTFSGSGGAVPTVIDTTTPVTVSTTNAAEYHHNQNATAATAITYNLPTASAGKQFCFTNSYNGSAADTGTLTLQTSASGQYIIFTDGTLSATGGYVISGGAASDAACVVGVDTTHWQLYTQRGTWTKH